MSLKGAIGRRIFAKSLPAAPLAAASVGPSILGNIATEGRRALPTCAQKDATAVVNHEWEAKRKKLDAARAFLYEDRRGKHIDYFRRRKNNWTTLDPNILALKSVSDQHKIHMHIAAEEKLDEERHGWQNSILRMFGLDDKRDRYELF